MKKNVDLYRICDNKKKKISAKNPKVKEFFFILLSSNIVIIVL